MNIPPGTIYTVTDGLNIGRILMLEQSHTLAGKEMQGIWNLHHSSTGHLLMDRKGSWAISFMAMLGIGSTITFYNERGKPLMILNASGSERLNGNGYIYGPVGNRGCRVKGYANLPLIAFDKMWFGFAMKWGGQLGPVGVDLALGALMNVETRQTATVQLQTVKGGLGLGGSASLTAILAFGFKTAQSMNGATSSGFDFALSLGQKWDGILKNMENSPNWPSLLGKFPDVCRYMEDAAVVAKGFRRIEKFGNWGKILASFSNVPTGDSTFVAFDVPWAGKGLEVGVTYNWTTIINVDGIDAPGAVGAKVPGASGAYSATRPVPTSTPRGLGRRDW